MPLRLVLGQSGGPADVVRSGGNLETDEGLEAAVTISLFTDGRAAADDVVSGPSRGGWWADAFADTPLGSRLWTLRRGTNRAETLRAAEGFVREALAWLVEDGIAAAVSAIASVLEPGLMLLEVVVDRATGGRWRHLWEVETDAV